MRNLTVKVVIHSVPDEATHFSGNLTDDPTWYKCKEMPNQPLAWFQYDSYRAVWMFERYCDSPAHFMKPLKDFVIDEQD